MELPVLTAEGKTTGRKVTLPASVFEATPHQHVVYLAVKQQLAHKRQGTTQTKTKGMVKASTCKLRKQKGSGKARVGSAKSGIRRGGGRTFGPQPRLYGFQLNKKEKALARRSVLSDQAAQGNIVVVEKVDWQHPKTKQCLALLASLGLSEQKTLLILPIVLGISPSPG